MGREMGREMESTGKCSRNKNLTILPNGIMHELESIIENEIHNRSRNPGQKTKPSDN